MRQIPSSADAADPSDDNDAPRPHGSDGQVTSDAAEVYDEFFVPALFGQFAQPAVDLARVRSGQVVLDVGTGTGAVARAALAHVGGTGEVIGIDPNPGMVAVARRHGVDARVGAAESIPLEDGSVDATMCQFALMFLHDRHLSVSEMARVTRPDGRVVISTWADASDSPGYAAMIDLLDDALGRWAADALRAPFCIGSSEQLEALVSPACPSVEIERVSGVARFASLDAWLHTEIRGWTLAGDADDEQFERLRRLAADRLAPFVDGNGRVEFETPALFASASIS